MNEFRKNSLKDQWVLIATNRAKNYRVSIYNQELPELENPFLPGNEEKTPPVIKELHEDEQWRSRTFSNKFPFVNLETPDLTGNGKGEEARGAFGAHEMIIDSREGDKHFLTFSKEDHELLLKTIRGRMTSLYNDTRIKSSFAYKEQGLLSGGTIPHSNTQLVSFGFIYPELDEEIRNSKKYFLERERSIFDDIIKNARKNSLVIEENRSFIAVIPYSARFEFETWIIPKFKGSTFTTVEDSIVGELSKITKEVLRKLHTGVGEVCLNWGVFSAPPAYEHRELDYFHLIDEHYRWYVEITPRIKPLGAMTTKAGFYVNTVSPEEAAEFLKKI